MNDEHKRSLQRFFTESRVVVLTVLISSLIILGVSFIFLDWLRTSSTTVETKTTESITTVATILVESGSTTVRTIGFVIAGVIAVVIAAWRGRVADRQANIAQENLVSQRLISVADQYQKATNMLVSPSLAIRLGGIHQLEGIANTYPAEYHAWVMQQLCSFVRHPTEVEGQPIVAPDEIELGSVYGASTAQDFAAAGSLEIEVVREDIRAAMDSIASCHARNIRIETLHNYWIDLHGADLRGIDLSYKDLSRAPEFDETSPFDFAVIPTLHTNLRGVKLHYSNLIRTNLTRTDLSHAIGLTQSILDDAYADPRMPPKLDYAFDVETGKQLIWQKTSGNHYES